MLRVNIMALTALCHRLIPMLRRHRPGAILNVSSIASLLPLPTMGVYAATKAYVSSFSESLRMELRGTGISVTYICPGAGGNRIPNDGPARGRAAPAAELCLRARGEVARAALLAVSRDRARVIPGVVDGARHDALRGGAALFVLRMFFESKSRAERHHRALQTA